MHFSVPWHQYLHVQPAKQPVLQHVPMAVTHGYGSRQSLSLPHPAPGQPHEHLLAVMHPYWHDGLACAADVMTCCGVGVVTCGGLSVSAETGSLLTFVCCA
jgi:hypothetical protein